jgi:FtsP/CotA-like multicopper oxidase with cupredoxin domain
LTPGPADIDLGGPVARTLAYNNSVPGPLIRANVGDELAISVTNGLDHPSSVHWHGIALRNDMDGATPATPNIDPSSNFTYRFSAPHPGTYWAHPHTGLDADYGLYVPVIIDDPTEPGRYDAGVRPRGFGDGDRSVAVLALIGFPHAAMAVLPVARVAARNVRRVKIVVPTL